MVKKSKKTAINPNIRYAFVAIAIFWITIITLLILDRNKETSFQVKNNPGCVDIGIRCYELEKAKTNEQRIKGLSGRENLPEKNGMLFVFDRSESQCMWMKDMKFSNDMIWLDDNKKVIQIRENISPDTYPESFCSDRPARYVIELNGGQVSSNQLNPGDSISF